MKIHSQRNIKVNIVFLLAVSLIICSLSGCSQNKTHVDKKKEMSKSGFAFNTTYTITLYDGGSKKLIDDCIDKCTEFENVFSRTLKGSELFYINEIESCYLKAISSDSKVKEMWDAGKVKYTKKQINNITAKINKTISPQNDKKFAIKKNGNIEIKVSELISDIVEKGLFYSKLSDGAFDITIEPVSSLWNFSSDKPKVPEKDKIKSAVNYIDYTKVKIDGTRLTFMKP